MHGTVEGDPLQNGRMLFIIGCVTLECLLVMSHEGHADVNSVSLRRQPFTCPPKVSRSPSAPRLPLSSGFLRGGLGFGSVPGVYRVEVFSIRAIQGCMGLVM